MSTTSNENYEQLRKLWPNPDLEDRHFNVLHKAVFEQKYSFLEETLSQFTTELINATDSDGRTALWWSARRADLTAVELLLRYGGDVNKLDNRLISPLSATLQPLNRIDDVYRCVQLLLDHGADVKLTNIDGWTPLDWLAANYDSLAILNSLVENGASVNGLKNFQKYPIFLAIVFGHYEVATRLIALGADIHRRSSAGESAFSGAVAWNGHKILKKLLQLGADHCGDIKENDYGSFLHIAVERADTKTLTMLTDANLSPRDMHQKRDDGLTPLDIAQTRTNVEPEWLDAFEPFLKSVDIDLRPCSADYTPRNRIPGEYPTEDEEFDKGESGNFETSNSGDQDSEDDAFVDVPEQQPN